MPGTPTKVNWKTPASASDLTVTGEDIVIQDLVDEFLDEGEDILIELPEKARWSHANLWDETAGTDIYYMEWNQGCGQLP